MNRATGDWCSDCLGGYPDCSGVVVNPWEVVWPGQIVVHLLLLALPVVTLDPVWLVPAVLCLSPLVVYDAVRNLVESVDTGTKRHRYDGWADLAFAVVNPGLRYVLRAA